MRPVMAATLIAGLVVLTVVSLLSPAWVLVLLTAAAFLFLRNGRAGFVFFAIPTLVINTIILALVLPGPHQAAIGPLHFGRDGAVAGLVGGLRLVSLMGCNLAVLSWFPAATILDGLRLSPRATAPLAATLIAAQDVGRDFRRIADARRLEQAWPRNLLRRAVAAARILPPLVVVSLRRADARRDALQLSHQPVGPSFAPVVAIAALAVAGRLAFLALPNIALTYVVVFLGGVLFGARVGMLAAILAMALTDVLLTGLLIEAFANVPAMALVALLGGILRKVDFAGGSRSDCWAGMLFAASAGVVGTLLFSFLSDLMTWLIVRENQLDPHVLWAKVVAGFAFNVVPAAVNAVLFAWSVGPVVAAVAAFRRAQQPSSAGRRGSTPRPGTPP